MAAYMDALPNEILLAIFERIPLLELLKIDQVCHRWSSLFSIAASKRAGPMALVFDGNDLGHGQRQFNVPLRNTLAIPTPPENHPAYWTMAIFCYSSDTTLKQWLTKRVDTRPVRRADDDADDELTEMSRFRKAQLSGNLRFYLAELFPNMDHSKHYVFRTEGTGNQLRLPFKQYLIHNVRAPIGWMMLEWAYPRFWSPYARIEASSARREDDIEKVRLDIVSLEVDDDDEWEW